MIGAAGGGEPELLTRGGGNFGFPSWSPDGKQIVYRAASAERNGLYIIDVATRKVTTLLEGKTHVNFPKWSPLGDRIAFTADIDGDYEVYTIAPDGKDLKRVTQSARQRRAQLLVARRRVARVHERGGRVQGRVADPPVQPAGVRRHLRDSGGRQRLAAPDGRPVRGRHAELDSGAFGSLSPSGATRAT